MLARDTFVCVPCLSTIVAKGTTDRCKNCRNVMTPKNKITFQVPDGWLDYNKKASV